MKLLFSCLRLPKKLRDIIQFCKDTVGEVKILPGVYQFLNGNVSISKIRPVEIEDLLGREPVQVDLKEISLYLKGKVVLVTGAGGSIGSELCRQIAQMDPAKIILLGHGETASIKFGWSYGASSALVPVSKHRAAIARTFL